METMNIEQLKSILEAAILAAGEPVNFERLRHLFDENEQPSTEDLRAALAELGNDCANRGIELKELASGFCFQAKAEFGQWIKRLWQEKPPRYSRAFLETLAVIAYRQPITRGEIEDIRGVAVSSNIIKMLLEREWVRIVGQREVPGRPSLYATTRQFLDHFNLQTLEDLPALTELNDIDQAAAQLQLQENVIEESISSAEDDGLQEEKNMQETAQEEFMQEDALQEEALAVNIVTVEIGQSDENEFSEAEPVEEATS